MERNFRSAPFQFLLFVMLFLIVIAPIPYITGHTHTIIPTEGDAEFSMTVVLDAGHGGEDGGASSAAGAVEKNLNLAIAEKLKLILEQNGVKVVMTRTTDILLYDRNSDYQGHKKEQDLATRRKIAEETPDSIFVSIHMNAYPQTQYSGLQIWYSQNNPRSRELADSIRETVCSTLQPDNNRKSKGATSSIYLLHHLNMPAVLVECGFLTNPEEAEKLCREDYQIALAQAIAGGILKAGT